MTEDEAKTTWCPRMPRDARDGDSIAPSQCCIGSRCQWWEWSEAKRTVAFLEAVQKHMKAQDKPNFNTAVSAVYADTGGQFARVEGDCGAKRGPQ